MQLFNLKIFNYYDLNLYFQDFINLLLQIQLVKLYCPK